MAHVEGEITIDRPIVDVFDFVADGRNEPGYNPNMLRVEQITAGPIGLGTRFRAVSLTMGRPVDMENEIVAYDRPHHFEMLTSIRAMTIRGRLDFEAIANGTRMRWSWQITPHGLYRLMKPLTGRIGNRQERRIWTGLKRLMESRQLSRLDASTMARVP
ncbi:MAG: SRPBCC family protein [Nitrolancea sp.]